MKAVAIGGVDHLDYQRHGLHSDACAWPETNCYADLWIGVLHALKLDPMAMLPFNLEADFEGDQWTFLKPSLDDLWTLYGIDVQELNIWDILVEHVAEQVSRGNLPLVEVDSYYLPDTSGTAYKNEHTKTTIGVNALDLDAQSLEYFHNGGYFAVQGDDMRNVLRIGAAPGDHLPPYAEFAKFSRVKALPQGALLEASLECARRHLAKRPRKNPLGKFRERLAREADAKRGDAVAHYHRYAFASVRQLGSAFQMAAAYARWLDKQRDFGLSEAAAAMDAISESSKALLFKMARLANTGKPLQYEAALDSMETNWQLAFELLPSRLGCS